MNLPQFKLPDAPIAGALALSSALIAMSDASPPAKNVCTVIFVVLLVFTTLAFIVKRSLQIYFQVKSESTKHKMELIEMEGRKQEIANREDLVQLIVTQYKSCNGDDVEALNLISDARLRTLIHFLTSQREKASPKRKARKL